MKLHPVSLAVLALFASLSGAARADTLRRPYIVQLADQPVASYSGGVAGLSGTRPASGQRLDLASTEVQLYADYLERKQASVQAIVAAAPVQYQYKVVLNGFAALLTDAEVRQLKASSEVASIVADEAVQLQTNYTPAFLGLDQPGGLWGQLGGQSRAGENIIVGVVDSGVWPENPAYADRVDSQGAPTFDPSGTLVYDAAPDGWKGSCQSGEGFEARHCNNKLIGAQFFNTARLADTARVAHWSEFVSPRDSIGGANGQGGHGTHTSTTAAGNSGVQTVVGDLPMSAASGMAPRARIAMYKVCWSYNDASDPTGAKNRCWGADNVAAIETAVKDGVHVINYSISGGATVTDPVEQAFLHASNAGIFVAVSGGNAGPANSVGHVSPWLTTVAASSHDRQTQAALTLANGQRYTGPSLNRIALPSTALIRAEDAGLPGADATKLALCYSAAGNGKVAVLDPAKVAGKIVTCTRGTNGRTDKSLAVQEAGGAGMVLVDNGAGLVVDPHVVPTVHVSAADGALIRAYALKPDATATMTRLFPGKGPGPAPIVADFSSRGPNRYDANTLKPDVSAPGVAILAGLTPALNQAEHDAIGDGSLTPAPVWGFYQGTSMASPHVAGIAALLRQQHPDWSPAAIKSALMTSGANTLADAQAGDLRGVLPFGQGAGHVMPNRASDPGLVYDLREADYRKYLCGMGIKGECANGAVAPYNLNLPSITVSNVFGTQTLTRTVTNVGASAATYQAAASISGYTLQVTPSSLTLQPGESKSFTVTATRTTAASNVWQYGALVWSDGVHSVRSPVTLRSGLSIIAPALLRAEAASGARLMTVTTGFTGKMSAASAGLKEVERVALNVAQAPAGSVGSLELATAACKAGAGGVRVAALAIPANAMVARVETFDRDTEGGTGHDLDLLVLNGAGAVVGTSMHDGSNEAVTLSAPAAGNYKVCVIGYASANGVSTDFQLSSAVAVKGDSGGNVKVTLPPKVYSTSTSSVLVGWSGLTAGKRYLGGVQLFDQGGMLGTTTALSVETDDPVPLANTVERAIKADNGR
ncbi:S8 family serine peptidase [Janthinobacterium fluminis]|uniref:S8 family serine peptidase n=1 Tax=Janthinobacterium fluminis TaxID=2987524 RepID=A0ABT5JY15_9BURK|nr:S8 family serine peptidase [Janthinobacterium fluminis]MDC8757627.1 S8 family serine peptidase [Janthinobacterium fluminis]